MLKDLKFAVETTLHASFLISVQLKNIFDKDLHKVNVTTPAFCKVL